MRYHVGNNGILYEVSEGVAAITLDRPEKLNAFTSAMLHDFLAAVREAEADDDVRAVLLTGEGRAFSAGQDLSDPAVSGDGADLGALLAERYNPIILALRTIPKPVVVAVNGTAAGAGANVALAGDVVLVSRSAKFIQAFSKIGLMPDSGGTWTLPHLVGHARALGLGLLDDPISAEQAKEWGLIWDVCDDDALLETARGMAATFAGGPTLAFGAIKRAIDAAALNTLDEQLDLERDTQRRLGHSYDYREGVAAFMEKRQPKFEGR
jgi:2-(1,2-epoxy-1,2-dihydrophenyl)acetyl-CoA isomerase